MYVPDSENKITVDFVMAQHDGNSNNNNKQHLPRAKVQPIKRTKNNKTSYLTVKETSLKVTHAKDSNEDYKDEIVNTGYNKEENEDCITSLDSKPPTPDLPNNGQLIDSDDEMDTTKTLLEEYYESKIDHNHPTFHMIREIVKEEHKALFTSINLFNISNLPNSSTNDMLVAKVAGSEIR